MMSDPFDSSKWQTPRVSEERHAVRKTEAEGPVDVEGKGLLPAAVVQPFSTGDSQSNAGADFLHRPPLRYPDFASPYLLSRQASSPSTPLTGYVNRPSPKSLSHEPFRSYSPNSQELELQSLRCQVKEIQNRLDENVIASSAYQQLLNEKLTIEHTLGATEHELQELKIAYSNVERSAAIYEEKMSRKMKDTMEKQQVILEKYNTAVEELRRLRDYFQIIPSQEEHLHLQQEVSKKSTQVTHLSDKLELMSNQINQLKERETKLEYQLALLSQENEDLSVKLRLTENILADIESQKAVALEEGEDTKEDLLWRLDQLEKELSSAKNLLKYRKQKLECVNQELINQEQKCNEKVQKEIDAGEKLRETVWGLQRELEEYKTNEQKMKTFIKKSEEKQKTLEERLQLTVMQIKNHHEMNSTITSLFSSLHKAVCTLKDLVKVSQQISQGITPDLSVLLSYTELEETFEGGAVSLEDMKGRLTEVRELIRQLESIRSALQDQHADQVAANICPQM